MLVSQSIVVTIPSVDAVVLNIPDTTPYARGVWMENLDTSNTLVITIETSSDGGVTWTTVGDVESIVPGGVASRWLVAVGPFLRVRGNGDGKLYFGMARYYKPVSVNLPLISLLGEEVDRESSETAGQ